MSSFLTDTELDREHAVRRYVCPTCHRGRNKPCLGLGQNGQSIDVSHTSRYRKGIASGLVPALPGDDG